MRENHLPPLLPELRQLWNDVYGRIGCSEGGLNGDPNAPTKILSRLDRLSLGQLRMRLSLHFRMSRAPDYALHYKTHK